MSLDYINRAETIAFLILGKEKKEALKKLIEEQGVKLREFSDDIYDSFGEASAEVFAEVQAHSKLAKKVHESFLKARKDVGDWANISDVAYISQRNRVLGK